MASLRELLQEKHDMRQRETVDVITNDEARKKYVAAKMELERLQERLDEETDKERKTVLRKLVKDAQKEYDLQVENLAPYLFTFHLISVGAKRWNELLKQYEISEPEEGSDVQAVKLGDVHIDFGQIGLSLWTETIERIETGDGETFHVETQDDIDFLQETLSPVMFNLIDTKVSALTIGQALSGFTAPKSLRR